MSILVQPIGFTARGAFFRRSGLPEGYVLHAVFSPRPRHKNPAWKMELLLEKRDEHGNWGSPLAGSPVVLMSAERAKREAASLRAEGVEVDGP